MVGCGSSARVANSPNAILPPELAMISSNSKARSTDCTPSATGTSHHPQSDQSISYCGIVLAKAGVCGMSQHELELIGSWRLYAVSTLRKPEGQFMTHSLTPTAALGGTATRKRGPVVERPAPLRQAVFE